MNDYSFYASTPDYSVKEYIYVHYIRDYLVAIVLTLFSFGWLYRKVISNLTQPLFISYLYGNFPDGRMRRSKSCSSWSRQSWETRWELSRASPRVTSLEPIWKWPRSVSRMVWKETRKRSWGSSGRGSRENAKETRASRHTKGCNLERKSQSGHSTESYRNYLTTVA